MQNNNSSRPVRKKIIFWILVLFSVFVFLSILLFLSLPGLASSQWGKDILREQASQALGRSVIIGSLNFDWSQGVAIQGLGIVKRSSSGNSTLLRLRHLHLDPQWMQLLENRAAVDVSIQGLQVEYLRRKDGSSNWDFLSSQQKPSTPGSTFQEKAPLSPVDINLPLDVGCKVRMQDVSLNFRDLQKNEEISLENAALSLDMPSLLHRPVNARVFARPVLNSQAVAPLRLKLHLQELFSRPGVIDPREISMQLSARAPGSSMELQGGLGKKGISGSLDMDPERMVSAFSIFLPEELPGVKGNIHVDLDAAYSPGSLGRGSLALNATDFAVSGPDVPNVSGNMGIYLQGAGDPGRSFSFDLLFQGEELQMDQAGKQIKGLELSLSQNGTYSPSNQTLQLCRGELQLQENSFLRWKGKISSLLDKSPHMDLQLSRARLGLGELLEPVSGYLPENISIGAEQKDVASRMQIQNLRLRGTLAKHSLDVQRLGISFPALQIRSGTNRLTTGEVALSLHNCTMGTKSLFPVRAETGMHLLVRDIAVQGPENATLRKLEIPEMHLLARDLDRKESLAGIVGDVSVSQRTRMQGVEVQNRAEVPGINSQYAIELLLKKSHCLLDLKKFRLCSPQVGLFSQGQELVQSGFNTRVQGDVLLDSLDPVRGDINNLDLQAALGSALQIKSELGAENMGEQGLSSRGKIKLDLEELGSLLEDILPNKGGFSGKSELAWSFSGRLPGRQEVDSLIRGKSPLRKRLLEADCLQDLQLKFSTDSTDLDWPLGSASLLQVRGMHTKQPLVLKLGQGLEHIGLSTHMQIEKIKNLPGLEALSSTPGLELYVNASVADLNRLHFREKVEFRPLQISQTAELTLEDFSQLLNSGSKNVLPLLFPEVQGSFSAGIRADFEQPPNKLTPEISAGNSLQASLDLQLQHGESINLGLDFNTSGLELNLKDTASIQNLQTSLGISKQYRLGKARKEQKAEEKAGLSNRVIAAPQKQSRENFSASGINRRDFPYWSKDAGISPDMSLEKLDLPGMPLQVEISDLSLDTVQHQGIPGIEKFQLDLWSGTIMGKARIVPVEDTFFLDTACFFTGVDAAAALPEKISSAEGGDTQISGRLSLNTPLAGSVKEMLNNLNMNLDLTHVGKSTLQRFLYAVDPSGNNEAVVRQRKLLDTARPKRINLDISQGSLSLTGTAEVKGIEIQLPPLKRLQLSDLPIQGQLQNLDLPLKAMQGILSRLSAEEIVLLPDNSLRWRKP